MKKFECSILKANIPTTFGKIFPVKPLEDAAREANRIQWTQFIKNDFGEWKFTIEQCYMKDDMFMVSGHIDEHLLSNSKALYIIPKLEIRFSRVRNNTRSSIVRRCKVKSFTLGTESPYAMKSLEPIKVIGENDGHPE